MYERVQTHLTRTDNDVEGWYNAFQSSIACSHPSICRLLKVLQREQSLQEAKIAKCEAGVTYKQNRKCIERKKQVQTLVSDYAKKIRVSRITLIFDFIILILIYTLSSLNIS